MKNKSNFQETFLSIILPLCLFVVCLIVSQIIMPKNCYLFDDRNFGQMCHTLVMGEISEPCPICENKAVAYVAKGLFMLSFGFLLLPFLIFALQRKNKVSK